MKQGITLPYWSIGVLVTIIMAIFSWGLATASSSSAVKNQVQTNTQILRELKDTDKLLQETKADKATIDNVYKALERIESKLDLHIVTKL